MAFNLDPLCCWEHTPPNLILVVECTHGHWYSQWHKLHSTQTASTQSTVSIIMVHHTGNFPMRKPCQKPSLMSGLFGGPYFVWTSI